MNDHHNIVSIRGNPCPWWESLALGAIRHLAESGRPFQAHDLDELGVPAPDHPNRYGSVFAKAKRAGLIRKVGYAPSKRPRRDGGVSAVWGAGPAVPPSTRKANP